MVRYITEESKKLFMLSELENIKIAVGEKVDEVIS